MGKTVLLIPGWHEKAHDLRTITHGRPPLPGLAARGFDPITFELRQESLPERIDRFARFVRELKLREPDRFPAILVGYSMGGIVVRGLFRRHPDLVADFTHVVALATPNWGLHLSVIPAVARVIGLPWRELYNIDPEHSFVPWLNGCDGKPERRGLQHICKMDCEPWVAPAGVKMLAIAGVVQRFKDGDGLVTTDSATMGGRIPSVIISDPHANHLNVTGETDFVATLVRGFLRSDGVWPRVIDAICAFVGGSQSVAHEPSADTPDLSLAR